MTHRETALMLADYVTARLGSDERRAVEAHLAECEECSEVAATYVLLACGLETERHPSSRLLAEFALESSSLPASDYEQVRMHLEACSDCRRMVELSGAAVRAARPHRVGELSGEGKQPRSSRFPAWARRMVRSPSRLAAAAGILAIVLLGTGVASLLSRGAGDSHPQTAIRGVKILEAESEILVADTIIESGADVTVRARDSVALGDGFSIAPDASLTIEVSSNGAGL